MKPFLLASLIICLGAASLPAHETFLIGAPDPLPPGFLDDQGLPDLGNPLVMEYLMAHPDALMGPTPASGAPKIPSLRWKAFSCPDGSPLTLAVTPGGTPGPGLSFDLGPSASPASVFLEAPGSFTIPDMGILRELAIRISGGQESTGISLVFRNRNGEAMIFPMTPAGTAWTWQNPDYVQEVRSREMQPLSPSRVPFLQLGGILLDGCSPSFRAFLVESLSVRYDKARIDP